MVLVKTCDACPEQYDVFHKKELVGYLRLRYGYFSASFPNSSGKEVYKSPIGDSLTGEFTNEKERKFHLKAAKKAIKKELKKLK